MTSTSNWSNCGGRAKLLGHYLQATIYRFICQISSQQFDHLMPSLVTKGMMAIDLIFELN